MKMLLFLLVQCVLYLLCSLSSAEWVNPCSSKEVPYIECEVYKIEGTISPYPNSPCHTGYQAITKCHNNQPRSVYTTCMEPNTMVVFTYTPVFKFPVKYCYQYNK